MQYCHHIHVLRISKLNQNQPLLKLALVMWCLPAKSHKDMAGHLMLSQKEVRDWCMKNRIDFHSMIATLQKEGALLKQGEKITLTRGTDVPMVQQRCLIIDTLKLDKDSVSPTLTLVSDDIDDMAVGDV